MPAAAHAVGPAEEGAPAGPRWRASFGVAWGVFWLLMITVAVQDHLGHGLAAIWQPLLWEGSSCLVASAIAWMHWSKVSRLDSLLHRPWQWLARSLKLLPVSAVAFVVSVYAIRHAVYALLGQTYRHAPWGSLFVYETLKFSIFFLLFAAVVFGIRAHAAMLAERWRAEHARALSQRAQLLQLTQQLEPHFLFNALNTIAATVHEDADRADALLTQLAALLRAATDLARRPSGPLAEELKLLQGYTAIMQERFGDRVVLQFDIDERARGCEVPTLLLQPLLENAYRHAVERTPGRVRIAVVARCSDGRLSLAVEDDAGVLPAAPVFGVGLSTLEQRLATAYGDAASLRLESREGGGVAVRVALPCRG